MDLRWAFHLKYITWRTKNYYWYGLTNHTLRCGRCTFCYGCQRFNFDDWDSVHNYCTDVSINVAALVFLTAWFVWKKHSLDRLLTDMHISVIVAAWLRNQLSETNCSYLISHSSLVDNDCLSNEFFVHSVPYGLAPSVRLSTPVFYLNLR